MKKIFFTCIFILHLSGLSFPQCKSFTVFHYSGKVYTSNSNKKQPVVIDQVIKEGIISLETGSQVILFDSSGNPVVLHQKGNYPFRQLQTICSESGNSITGKYFQFIWSRIFEEKKQDRNTINASVTREKISLMIFPTDSSLVVQGRVNFRWKSVQGSKDYYIIILDPTWNLINTARISDTSYSWIPDSSNLIRGKRYYWYVSDIPYPPAEPPVYSFSFATLTQERLFSTELNELIGQLNYTPAINSLLLAGFYEEKSMFGEAYTKYHEALLTKPGDPLIQKALNDFLRRINYR